MVVPSRVFGQKVEPAEVSKMLKIMAAGMAVGIALGGAAMAQTPAAMPPGELLLVKHDGDGPGRKLGHYKQKHKDKHGRQDRNSNQSGGSRLWYEPQRQYNYAPQPYYGTPPGYGSSYPPSVHIYPGVYQYGY
jgi:hypothetical protein